MRGSGMRAACSGRSRVHAVEEPQGAHDRADAGGLEAAGDQVELVVAHVLERELVRRAAVEGAEAGDRAHVAAAGAVGHVAQPHVVEHALAQRGRLSGRHGDLLSVGLPKPGDPGRRRRPVYDLMYSESVAKGRKSNLERHLNMALLSHSLLSGSFKRLSIKVRQSFLAGSPPKIGDLQLLPHPAEIVGRHAGGPGVVGRLVLQVLQPLGHLLPPHLAACCLPRALPA